MEVSEVLISFLSAVAADPRIGPTHISLYSALLGIWEKKGRQNPITIFSREVMPLCKIFGLGTYHRCIKELHAYGYIKYQPSHNHFSGSLVYL